MPSTETPRISGSDVLAAREEFQTIYHEQSLDFVKTRWMNYSHNQRMRRVLLCFLDKEEFSYLLEFPAKTPKESRLRRLLPELVIEDMIIGDSIFTLMDTYAATAPSELLHVDLNAALKSIKRHCLSHPDARSKMRMVFSFKDETVWGKVVEARLESQVSEKDIAGLAIIQESGLFTSENLGLLIIERQLQLYKFLGVFIRYLQGRAVADHLMNQGPQGSGNLIMCTRDSEKYFCSLPDSGKAKFSIVILDAQAASIWANDHVKFLLNEPLYLYYCVNNFYLSHSIHHPDAAFIKANCDHTTIASASVMNLLVDAFSANAYWNYINKLLLGSLFLTDPARIWHTSCKELSRALARFRWFLVTDPNYSKYYTVADPGDLPNGDPPNMRLKKAIQVDFQEKSEPTKILGDLKGESELTTWMLSLADAVFTHQDVSKVLKQINEYMERVPQARESISERLGEALATVSVVSGFMDRCEELWGLKRLTSTMIYAPPEDIYDLGPIWKTLDWACWYFPRFDLKGNCVNATGGFAQIAYACIDELLLNHEEGTRALPGKLLVSFHPAETRGRKFESIDRTSKKATSSTMSGASSATSVPPAPTITVSASALKTFRKIFRAELDGTIAWPAFQYAMGEAGFNVRKLNSSISRLDSLRQKHGREPINVCRPYPNDRFESWTLLKLNLKLTSQYGWTRSTFGLEKK